MDLDFINKLPPKYQWLGVLLVLVYALFMWVRTNIIPGISDSAKALEDRLKTAQQENARLTVQEELGKIRNDFQSALSDTRRVFLRGSREAGRTFDDVGTARGYTQRSFTTQEANVKTIFYSVFMLGALISPTYAIEHCQASRYSVATDGVHTASGIKLNDGALTAAHKTLPFGTEAKVTNKNNGRSVVVKITDRGPFIRGRCIDLTIAAERAIGMNGLAPVTVEVEGR